MKTYTDAEVEEILDKHAEQPAPPEVEIELFSFGDTEVRVISDDPDNLMWVASDIAKALGYRDAEKMARNIRDRHRGTRIVGTPSGPQEMTVISEPGLYSAILKSRVELAEPFQDWVTDEVLPTIRKEGGYISKHASEKQLENLQDELDDTKNRLNSALSGGDQVSGQLLKARRELDGYKEVYELKLGRQQSSHNTNVYDYLVERTGHHGFAYRNTFELAKAATPYSASKHEFLHADNTGIYVPEQRLDEAWKKYNYDDRFRRYKDDLNIR